MPIVGDNAVGGVLPPLRRPREPPAHRPGLRLGAAGPRRPHPPARAVTGFRTAGGRVTAVETAAGPVGADAVVLAAGPQTERLAALLGVRVPLAPSRVEMICTEPLPLMQVGGVDGNGLYGRQTRRGNLVYGGGPHEWLDGAGLAAAPGRGPRRRSSGASAAGSPSSSAAPPTCGSSGAGPAIVENTPDGLPVIDRLAAPDNVVVATMSSVGFGLSPATGKAISELVLHGGCPFADLGALRLARFADTPPDWRARLGWLPSVESGQTFTSRQLVFPEPAGAPP